MMLHPYEFENWVSGFRDRASAALIRMDVFDAAFAGTSFNPDVIERQRNQPEFVLSIREYLEAAVSEDRVRNGRIAQRKHRALLNRIETETGVGADVVTAIWGLESAYGLNRGTFPVIEALASLACCGERRKYFEDELIVALRILQSGEARQEELVGSWAGAMGHGQFMPSSYFNFSWDFDGDGWCNIWGDDPTDALASIACYLRKHNWRAGQPWGFEVALPQGYDFAQSGFDRPKPVGEWSAMGIRPVAGGMIPDYGPASIFLPAGAAGPALMVFRNFHVIAQYNRSNNYALAVGHLGDRLRRDPPFRTPWPENLRALTRSEIRELQGHLADAGFDPKGHDGVAGANTFKAARAYQLARGLLPDGFVGPALLDHLRSSG